MWENDDRYAGGWCQGMMQGRGTFTWTKGDVYDGEWRRGQMNGHGIKKMSNGDIYEGQWDCDKASPRRGGALPAPPRGPSKLAR